VVAGAVTPTPFGGSDQIVLNIVAQQRFPAILQRRSARVLPMRVSQDKGDRRSPRRPISLLAPVGDETVHVRDDGPKDASPIVLVHGFLGSMHWFDRLIPLLSNDFRVIRTDLIGHGASSDNKGGYAPEQQARVLSSLLEELGVQEATLVGHSMGGDIAIAALEQGLMVTNLVIINEGPDYTSINRSRVNSVLRVPGIGSMLYRSLSDAAIRAAVATFFAPGFPIATAFDVPERPVWDVRAVKYACFRGSQVEKERYVRDRPLDNRLRALGVRTLVLVGEKDQVYGGARAADRYRAVPTVTVETTIEAGHSPMLESPDWTANKIRHFVETA
jgi:pimeloyl-ACP methyl ester carboxylesterase